MKLKAALINVVGENGIIENPPEIEKEISPCSLLANSELPQYIVFPSKAGQVSRIVSICNDFEIPLTPRSSMTRVNDGPVPLHNGIILDLSRMNKVISLDLKNRNIMIEPGVTWEIANKALDSTGMMIPCPLFPASGQSVLTSTFERQPRVIPKFEYGEPISSFEMIWPTGEIFRSGSASSREFPHNFAQACYPHGPGPIDPLRLLQGAQGTMGVVTWANIKIEQRPSSDYGLLIPFDSLPNLIKTMYAIQERRIGNECFAMNRVNLSILLASITGMSPEALALELPQWAIVLLLSGGKWFPEEKIEYQKKELLNLMHRFFPSVSLITRANKPTWLERLPAFLRSPVSPSDSLWFRYYGKDTDKLFFLSTIEMIPLFVENISKVFATEPLENLTIGIYIQPIDYCAGAHLEFDFYWQKVSKNTAHIIKELLLKVVSVAMDSGAHFTRPYGREVSNLVFSRIHPSYVHMLKKIKAALDPKQIMNPGKLCF